jgi:hypothetical protein
VEVCHRANGEEARRPRNGSLATVEEEEVAGVEDPRVAGTGEGGEDGSQTGDTCYVRTW